MVKWLIWMFVLVIMLGYIGKAVYLSVTEGTKVLDVISEARFWVPDGFVFLFGFAGFAAVWIFFVALAWMLHNTARCFGACLCCPSRGELRNSYYVVLSGEDTKRGTDGPGDLELQQSKK